MKRTWFASPAVAFRRNRFGWLVAFAVVATTGCAGDSQAVSPGVADAAMLDVRTMVDDHSTGVALDRFQYAGHWEKVKDRSDGRSLGTSTRSFHRSDLASLSFSGTQVRLYGVLGPKGGDAVVTVDGLAPQVVRFHAEKLATDALVYTSPRLDPNVHTLTIYVTGRDGVRGGGFVNVDAAVISAPPPRG